MEVLRLHGYTEPEKVEIAKQFLVKKQMAQGGADGEKRPVPDDAIRQMIRGYTREAGVRKPGARNRQRLPQSRAQGGKRRGELRGRDRT